MKNLIGIILLLFSFTVNAQLARSGNALSFNFQVTDLGMGIRYDHKFFKTGIYTSFTKGNYKFWEFYIKDHYKYTIGITKFKQDNIFFSGGLTYNWYGNRYLPVNFNKFVLFPLSFELGMGVFEKLSSASREGIFTDIQFDFIKWESTISLGLMF